MKLSQNEFTIAVMAINQYIDTISPILDEVLKDRDDITTELHKAYKKVINDLRKQAGKEELK